MGRAEHLHVGMHHHSRKSGYTSCKQALFMQVYSQWDKHVGEALAVFDGILQKDPQDFRAYLAKGVLLRREGRKGDAQRAFLQARYNAPPEALNLIERVISSGAK